MHAVSDNELLECYAALARILPLPSEGSGELRVEAGSEAARPEGVGDAARINSSESASDCTNLGAQPIEFSVSSCPSIAVQTFRPLPP